MNAAEMIGTGKSNAYQQTTGHINFTRGFMCNYSGGGNGGTGGGICAVADSFSHSKHNNNVVLFI
ncbi:MAG: hypothetical protein WC756_19815 [Taibaiella sp.]|jgi:hypothetical protein